MIRHSPSHWAPPISCGGPCSTPGPLFLQLFNLFLRLKFTARPSPPPPPQTPLHLKQTPQESSLLLQQGGLFARQGLHRDNSGLYAFMKLSNTHTLKCFKGWLLVHASDYLKCIVVDVIIHIWGFCKYSKILITVAFEVLLFHHVMTSLLVHVLDESREEYVLCLLYWNQLFLHFLVPFYHSWLFLIVQLAVVCRKRVSFSWDHFAAIIWSIFVEIGHLIETMQYLQPNNNNDNNNNYQSIISLCVSIWLWH